MRKKIKKIREAPEKWKRSIAKSISYRLLVIVLDFVTITLFTKNTKIAVGFIFVSNAATAIAYLAHERIWSRIGWGIA